MPYEIIKLMKKSPTHETMFKRLKAETDIESLSLGIHVLCPTKWTISYNFGKSVWSVLGTQKWRQGFKALLLRWLSLTTFWHLIGSVNITTYWVLAKQYNKHICQQQKANIFRLNLKFFIHLSKTYYNLFHIFVLKIILCLLTGYMMAS